MNHAPARARRRPLVPAGLVVVGLAALVGCGGDDTSASVEIPNVFELAHDPTSAIPDVDPDAPVEVMPADLLRSRLEKELTWHGITLVQVMRAAHDGDASGCGGVVRGIGVGHGVSTSVPQAQARTRERFEPSDHALRKASERGTL